MTIPTGLVLVPREPTSEMKIVGAHVCDQRPSEVAEIYKAMIASAPSPWRDIESAPLRDDKHYLIFNAHGNICVAKFGVRYLGDFGPEAWICEGKYVSRPTHWMPLPDPPKESDSEKT